MHSPARFWRRTVARCARFTLPVLMLALTSMRSPSPAAADTVTLGDGLKAMGCIVSTIISVIPGGSVVSISSLVNTVVGTYLCPTNIHKDDYVNGCYPQLGSYSTCPWAANSATPEGRRVQEWISSGKAANGMHFSERSGGLISDGEGRLTCVFIVAAKGMDAPEAAWDQNGCVVGGNPSAPKPGIGQNIMLQPLHSGPPRIMAVGDSITHGKSGDYTWRYRLHEHLASHHTPFDFVGPFRGPMDPNSPEDVRAPGTYRVQGWDDDHDATWGRFLGFEKSSIADYVRMYGPDLLIVHLGTNDLTWGWNDALDAEGNAAATAGSMRELIQNARQANPNVNFLLVQIGETAPMAAKGGQASYNRRLEELANELNQATSRIAVTDLPGWNRDVDTYDGTHPNEHGEYVIAAAVANRLNNHWGYGSSFGAIPAPRVPPPIPQHVLVTPNPIRRDTPFTVSWDRVTNPNNWTEYRVEVHYHHDFGYGLVWQSPKTTPDLSMKYTGPVLPQTGVFHVVVVAVDQYGKTTESALTPLTVADLPPPPPSVQGLRVEPALIGRDGGFIASWNRVTNPGIWTEYKVQLRTHQAYGDQQVWETTGTTPDLSVMYDGPKLPLTGVYQVVVIARDPDGQESIISERVPLTVQETVPRPLAPQNVRLSKSSVWRNGDFEVSWDRVPNPKIWTDYTVQVRNHRDYGYKVIWEMPSATPALSARYEGPILPQAGVYHVVVAAHDPFGQVTLSEPVPLEVTGDPPAPPPPTNVQLSPNHIHANEPFQIAWDRVQQPGVWTEYKVEVHYHQSYGFGMVWEMPSTTTATSVSYGGPALPQSGVFHVVVVARDSFEHTSQSAPVELFVD